MTTTGPVETSPLTTLFNIQYPNARNGMFCLRQPFKNMSTVEILPDPQQMSPANVVPTVLDTEQTKQRTASKPPQSRQKSKQSAAVQCSLLIPVQHYNMAVQTKIDREQKPTNYIYEDEIYDDYDSYPRPRHHRKPIPPDHHQKVYEIWDVESSPTRKVPIHPSRRHDTLPRVPRQRLRRQVIEYPYSDEYESDHEHDNDDERVVYVRRPKKPIRKTYLPPNVQMLCVRDEANRMSH